MLPLVLGWLVLFGPIHIAFVEMIIDPVCALVFEAEAAEDNIMQRKPRAPDQPLFSLSMVGWSVVQGGLAFAMLAAAYLTATALAMPQPDVRELVFLSLITSIVALILANRSFDISLRHAFTRRNIMLRAVLGAVTAVLAMTLLVPSFRTLLKFGTPDWPSAGMALGLGGLLLVLLEGLKALAKHRCGQAKAQAA